MFKDGRALKIISSCGGFREKYKKVFDELVRISPEGDYEVKRQIWDIFSFRGHVDAQISLWNNAGAVEKKQKRLLLIHIDRDEKYPGFWSRDKKIKISYECRISVFSDLVFETAKEIAPFIEKTFGKRMGEIIVRKDWC